MIEELLAFTPFLSIFIAAILSVSVSHKNQMKNIPALCGLGGALLANSLLLIFLQNDVHLNAFTVNTTGLWLNEILISALLIIFLSVPQNLKDSHTAELINSTFLLFAAAIVGINITENLLVISIFYIFAAIGQANLFFFGRYRKKMTLTNRYLAINVMAALTLIILSLIIQTIYGTMELSELAVIFDTQPLSLQILLFLGLVIGFGAIPGIIPFLHFHQHGFLEESNPINLRLITNIFVPVSGLLLLRVTSICNPTNLFFGQVFYAIGSLGFIVATLLTIIELFGKFKERSRSIPKILGYLSIAELHMYLLVGALYRLNFAVSASDIGQPLVLLLLLSIFAKSLILEALSPIFDDVEGWDLKTLGGLSKYYPKFLILLFLVPFLYALPGLGGYAFYTQILPAAATRELIQPVQTAQLWSILTLIIAYHVLLFAVLATIINETFLGKSVDSEREVVAKASKIYYYPPILLLIAYFLFAIIISGDTLATIGQGIVFTP